MENFILLGIDTSSQRCAVGLLSHGQILASRSKTMKYGHSEYLLPFIQECQKSISVGMQDLSGVVVTRGPGGFTGLRVGLSCARTLGLCLKIPVVGLSCFYALAIGLYELAPERNHRLLVSLKRGLHDMVFGQIFFPDLRVYQDPFHVPLKDLSCHLPQRPMLMSHQYRADVEKYEKRLDVEYVLQDDLCQLDQFMPYIGQYWLNHQTGYEPDPLYFSPASITI